MSAVRRHQDHGAVLLMDLDGFKQINDKYGHDAGDLVLQTVAQRLQQTVRREDIVGRLGGDEFLIFVHYLNSNEVEAKEKVQKIAQKLIQKIQSPIDFQQTNLHVGASIGVSLIGFKELDVGSVIKRADRAMYRAKRGAQGRVVFYQPGIEPELESISDPNDLK